MNLLDIKSHLMTVKIASLATLANHFQCDTSLLRNMLSHWVRKGQVKCCTKTPQCGVKCVQCKTESVEIYEWVSVG